MGTASPRQRVIRGRTYMVIFANGLANLCGCRASAAPASPRLIPQCIPWAITHLPLQYAGCVRAMYQASRMQASAAFEEYNVKRGGIPSHAHACFNIFHQSAPASVLRGRHCPTGAFDVADRTNMILWQRELPPPHIWQVGLMNTNFMRYFRGHRRATDVSLRMQLQPRIASIPAKPSVCEAEPAPQALWGVEAPVVTCCDGVPRLPNTAR